MPDKFQKNAFYNSLGITGFSEPLSRSLASGEALPQFVASVDSGFLRKYELKNKRYKLIGQPLKTDPFNGAWFICGEGGEYVVYVGHSRHFQGFQVVDKTGKIVYEVKLGTKAENRGFHVPSDAIELNPNEFALSWKGGLIVMKIDSSGKWTHKSFSDIPNGSDLSYNKKSKVLGVTLGNTTRLYDWDGLHFKIKATVLYRGENLPSVILPDQRYFCPDGSSPDLAFVRGMDVFPFEQFDLRLNRPDIVLDRLGASKEAVAIALELREKRLKRAGVTEEMLSPEFHLPSLEIVGAVPASTSSNDLALKIKASDSKYSLERLRVYLNNVPINGQDGELLRGQKIQLLERTIPVHLAEGRNKVQVSVLNSAGAESLYASAEVNCTAQRPKPTLWTVSMGVSEYRNPEWNLKYAAKDARDISDRIRARSGGAYSEVKELVLTDREVTKESTATIRKFLSKATVDDTVILFVAGHGLLDEKYDYYFGTSNVDFMNPAAAGIAFEEFEDILAELPCLKKSFLIDTCHAGELDEDEKKALAAARGASDPLGGGPQLAMHRVGARGLFIKPIEGARGRSEWYDRLQGLFVDLRRGSGSTILSSSAGAEYALESSEQANGLFTYAVLEALDGKGGVDLNKDGFLQISELAAFLKKRVSELSKNKQTPNIRRVNIESDFAIASKSK
jgi:uncharacterized caspase-like protein